MLVPARADLYRAVLRCRRPGYVADRQHRQPERRRVVPAGQEHAPDDVCKPVPCDDATAATTGRHSGRSHRSIRVHRRVRTPPLVGRTGTHSSRTVAPTTTASEGQGGSKDQYDPALGPWLWSGSDTSPDKNDIQDAFAAIYHTTDQQYPPGCQDAEVPVLRSDRLDTSGDAQQGFQFLQNNTCLQPAAGGTAANGNPCPAGVPAIRRTACRSPPTKPTRATSSTRAPAVRCITGTATCWSSSTSTTAARLEVPSSTRGSARTAPVQGATERLRRPVRRPRRAFVPSPSCSEAVRTALPSRARTTSARRRTRPISRTSRSGRTPTRTPAIRMSRRPSSRPGST